MSKVIQGDDLMLFVKKGEAVTSIAGATSHKISISAETVDCSSKDDGSGRWSSEQVKKFSWEASSENLFTDSTAGIGFADLYALMVAGTAIDAVFNIAENEDDITTSGFVAPTSGILKGKVIITNLELNSPHGDNVTYSVTFKGVGELSAVTAAA